eukprot:GHVP01059688.1.p1 GENE.GHVP01059688.1~~GHVP01059688.1.p1  ORF type:complete len:692 (+),score=138.87 GHVP01059688.1:2625-4700(+)
MTGSKFKMKCLGALNFIVFYVFYFAKKMDQEDLLNLAKDLKVSCAEIVRLSNGLPSGDSYTLFESNADKRKKLQEVNDILSKTLIQICTAGSPSFRVEGEKLEFGDIIGALEELHSFCDEALKIDVETPQEKVGQLYTKSHRKRERGEIFTEMKGAKFRKKLEEEENKSQVLSFDTRPQTKFEFPIRNFSPQFVPRLVSKPHAIEPLCPLLVQAQLKMEREDAIEKIENLDLSYSTVDEKMTKFEEEVKTFEPLEHPYKKEIMNLFSKTKSCDPTLNSNGVFKYGDLSGEIGEDLELKREKVTTWRPLSQTPMIYVENVKAFEHMIEEILLFSYVSVDVEHHSTESFYGITCLIQLSTSDKDYILDPFPIWNVMPKLNKIFANPRILKIFHGSNRDMLWLSRDFSLYVVNLFDTGVAAKKLQVPGGYSLKNLLHQYCSIQADKAEQMSDWRKRPLSADQLRYAREDTHYLYYVFQIMRNQLLLQESPLISPMKFSSTKLVAGQPSKNPKSEIGKRMLLEVLINSSNVSLTTWEVRITDRIMRASRMVAAIHPLAWALLMRLLKFREGVARIIDVNPQQIFEDRDASQIAMNAPESKEFLLGLFSRGVPFYFEKFKDSIIDLVKEVKKIDPEEVQSEMNSSLFDPPKRKNDYHIPGAIDFNFASSYDSQKSLNSSDIKQKVDGLFKLGQNKS